jgi:hypothetical protein
MPIIAALLFEFCLREMRLRTANRADRTLSALRWLRPAERIRVQICLAADDQVSAEEATRGVRIDSAARRLYQLRALLRAHERATGPAKLAARRTRRAERRAHGALIRAGFTEPLTAFAVLRQVQVMTQTATLARLDYDTADAAQAAIANLISSPAAAAPAPDPASRPAQPAARDATGTEIAVQDCRHTASVNGHRLTDGTPARAVPAAGAGPETSQQEDNPDAGDRDAELVSAARRVVADARQAGTRLSQIALAEKLRGEGYKVANNRLRWLAAVSGLEAGQDGEPDTRSSGGR